MKKSLSSVDLHFLLGEWRRVLLGARFDKAYQIGGRDVLLRFHKAGRGRFDFVVTPSFACITAFKWETPQNPSSFAMQLRKNLSSGFVREVSQAGFDRILELKIESKLGFFYLVFELFSKGNVFLLDADRRILGLIEWQRWKDRLLGVKQIYEYPPKAADPRTVGEKFFRSTLIDSDKPCASVLAVQLGLTGFYAREVCLKSGVEQKTASNSLGDAQLDSLWKSFSGTVSSFSQDPKPVVVFDGENPVDVLPIPSSQYSGLRFEGKKSFNDAVDFFFARQLKDEIMDVKQGLLDDKSSQLESRLTQQKKGLNRLEDQASSEKMKGDLVYQHYQFLSEVISDVNLLRKKSASDSEIKNFLAGKYGEKIVDLNKYSLKLDLD